LLFVHHHILAILPILLPNALHKFYKTYTLEKKAIIPIIYFSNWVNTQAKNIIYPPNTNIFSWIISLATFLAQPFYHPFQYFFTTYHA
jgi:hypothetical protein